MIPRLERITAERITGWLLAVVAACASTIGGLGVVLCFEPDGHVSIEFGGDDCEQCCAGDSGGSREVPEQRIGACACQDLTVSVDLVRVRSAGVDAELAAWAASPVWPAVASARPSVPPTRRTDLPRSPSSAALPFVRSVVLLV